MIFIAHRINTIKELNNIDPEYGVEVDIRDYGDKLVLVHDPFIDINMVENFDEYLKHYKHKFIVLNIKSERIEYKVLELMKKYNIKDYFFLDSSFPMIYKLTKEGERKIALRYSEYESIESVKLFADKIEWIWIDCFNKYPLDKESYEYIKKNNIKICLVSPELQGHNIEKIREVNNYEVDMVCTKYYNIDKWMKKNILIHHQGWGDLLTCNGLIRYYCEKYGKIVLIMRKDAKELCDYMYKDLIENNILKMDYIDKTIIDSNIKQYIDKQYGNCNILSCGMCFDYLNRGRLIYINNNISFGHQFYENYGIDSINRIKYFDIKRDYELEDKKYKEVIKERGKDYIVVHEDIDRNIRINRKYINDEISLYNLDKKSYKIFDMIKIIENAKEIHLIESTYSIVIYLLQQKYGMFKNINIYMHSYVRQNRNIDLYKNPNFECIWIN